MFDEYPEPLWNPVKSEVRAAVKEYFEKGDEKMTRLVDPIDGDPTKIRVPDVRRETYPDGSGMLSCGTKVVPAKLVERPCPHCGGKGTVLVKEEVPKGVDRKPQIEELPPWVAACSGITEHWSIPPRTSIDNSDD